MPYDIWIINKLLMFFLLLIKMKQMLFWFSLYLLSKGCWWGILYKYIALWLLLFVLIRPMNLCFMKCISISRSSEWTLSQIIWNSYQGMSFSCFSTIYFKSNFHIFKLQICVYQVMPTYIILLLIFSVKFSFLRYTRSI